MGNSKQNESSNPDDINPYAAPAPEAGDQFGMSPMVDFGEPMFPHAGRRRIWQANLALVSFFLMPIVMFIGGVELDNPKTVVAAKFAICGGIPLFVVVGFTLACLAVAGAKTEIHLMQIGRMDPKGLGLTRAANIIGWIVIGTLLAGAGLFLALFVVCLVGLSVGR